MQIMAFHLESPCVTHKFCDAVSFETFSKEENSVLCKSKLKVDRVIVGTVGVNTRLHSFT